MASFGSEAAIGAALQDGNVDALASVKGISRERAVQYVLTYRGEGSDEWLRTPRARELFRDIVERLQRRAATTSARNRIELMVPTSEGDRIRARRETVEAWHQRFVDIDVDELARALRGLGAWREPRPRPVDEVLVLVETDEDHEVLDEAGLTRWVEVATPDDPAVHGGLVIYASRDGLVDVGPEVLQVPFTTAEDIVPWPTVARFEHNRSTLEAAAEVSRLLDEPSPCAEALECLSEAAAAEVSFDDVREAAQEAVEAANAAIEEQAADLTLSGKEVLEALAGRASAIEGLVASAHSEARRQLRERTGLDLPVFTEAFPLEVDERELDAARRRFEAQSHAERYHSVRAVASRLRSMRSKVDAEIERALEVDHYLAIERFRRDHACCMPDLEGAFEVEGALHLELAGHGAPVDYDLGAGVALLTGANSGGKTTLLETLGQVAIAAHMGLPVPAKAASVPVLDGLYFFTRPRGLDAGAFETFLSAFEPVALDPDRCLVLADELEAMTELEAAGAILGVLVNRLKASNSPAVVVTHLADAILAHADVRVDGIEARGLDENDELIVDRTPRRDHRARSTPEFVLQRLRNRREGDARELYDEMLGILDK